MVGTRRRRVPTINLLFLICLVRHALADLSPQLFGFVGACALCFPAERSETIGEQHGQQTFHDVAGAAIFARAHDHTRDNIHLRVFHSFGKTVEHRLRHLELRSTIRADLFFGGEGLRDTNAGDLLSLGFCQRADLCRGMK